MNRIPDLLTMSRGLIAVAIFSLGFVGPGVLPIVLILTMVGWTTDILDGRIARKIQKPPSWVGEKEFAFDMLMVFSGLCYLVLSGLVPFLPAIIYVMVAAAFIAYFRSKAVTMSFATPLVALPLVIAYFKAPTTFLWFIVWIVAALALDWKRFKHVVLEFIENTKKLARR